MDLLVEEHGCIVDRLARDVEVVGGKVLDGVANGEAAQNLVLVRDVESLAHDVGKSRDEHLDAGAQPTVGQSKDERLQIHTDAETVDVVKAAGHTHDAGKRGVVEPIIESDSLPAPYFVVSGDAETSVKLCSQFIFERLEVNRKWGISGSRIRDSFNRAPTSRSRAAPEASTRRQGWVLEFEGARRASSRAPTTCERGTGLSGWNSLIDLRVCTTRSNSATLHFPSIAPEQPYLPTGAEPPRGIVRQRCLSSKDPRPIRSCLA